MRTWGIGYAEGDKRAIEAAKQAIQSPLLETTIDGARGVLINVTGGSDLGLAEINESALLIQEAAHPEANIIFGADISDDLGEGVRITVIATGFENQEAMLSGDFTTRGEYVLRKAAARHPRQQPANKAARRGRPDRSGFAQAGRHRRADVPAWIDPQIPQAGLTDISKKTAEGRNEPLVSGETRGFSAF